PPGVPVDGVVGVLEQIGTRLAGETVWTGHGTCWHPASAPAIPEGSRAMRQLASHDLEPPPRRGVRGKIVRFARCRRSLISGRFAAFSRLALDSGPSVQ